MFWNLHIEGKKIILFYNVVNLKFQILLRVYWYALAVAMVSERHHFAPAAWYTFQSNFFVLFSFSKLIFFPPKYCHHVLAVADLLYIVFLLPSGGKGAGRLSSTYPAIFNYLCKVYDAITVAVPWPRPRDYRLTRKRPHPRRRARVNKVSTPKTD